MQNDKKFKDSRRGFLRGGMEFLTQVAGEFATASRKASADEGKAMEVKQLLLRPPGAVSEETFLNLCDKCDDCIKACPEKTLFRAPQGFNEKAGTPMFDPAGKPCFVCTELYCIKACQTGALKMVSSPAELAMGKAKIISANCRAYEGEDCRFCIDFCPLEDKSIVEFDGKPLIKASQCIGCGLCQYSCLTKAGRQAIETQPTPL